MIVVDGDTSAADIMRENMAPPPPAEYHLFYSNSVSYILIFCIFFLLLIMEKIPSVYFDIKQIIASLTAFSSRFVFAK